MSPGKMWLVTKNQILTGCCLQMPSNSSNSPSYFFHSAQVGPAHVINLSPYVDYTPGSAQWQWLAEDLAGINRSITPWVIVDIHNPW